ncbi:uncharacterized protein BX664DRAFT_336693 [Halteromyces radiatus]|uniref:uncharacterized protein n=1 Tax=Halteromyces radiatus TaxID=101107 RepID=UPI00221EDA4E|nr:uncharacterized protein BX664DRAFT_336693 [Halteromyces radiatus]KAI8086761.1 hypothetical protein BX664DRAFT_336693 [Halteromyces radiatus]
MLAKSSSQKRLHLGLILFIITFLLIIFYIRHSSFDTSQTSFKTHPKDNALSSQDRLSFILNNEEAIACNNADITWLASDRQFWDGWSTKAMFLQPNGNFTTNNVLTTEGVAICIVVLLGPSPATSVIRAENHLGPADSIVIEAIGNTTVIPIELQQHHQQPNAYFASVYFAQADTYVLKGRIEYRSYFWEQPIYHSYRPITFTSVNKAMVKSLYKLHQPACNARNPDHWQGVWMNKTTFQSVYPLDFYGMFGPVQEDHAEFDRLFVPDHCRMEYISYGQASQCLQEKVIHVWADGNLRRNLKAFDSANRWCNENKTAECICNDDKEDPNHKMYPWAVDPTIPLVINKTWHGNTEIYYNQVDSITTMDWKKKIKFQTNKLSSKADIVILGFGNQDIPLTGVSPKDFGQVFYDLLHYVMNDIYPYQTIIVRSPQYYCCGTLGSTSWNSGRSAAFARVVRQIVQQLSDDRVLLWDVYKLGIEENTCIEDGSTYSRKNVINVENILLWNLLCPSKSV